ncbi:hypothetical protein P12x_001431 [Tundrisphaera lichenicola]|uniref:hypothetical protein n=1 Tax=Tundrisphaera lichenicola TaxID=2029860 RepID=UPI003EBE6224
MANTDDVRASRNIEIEGDKPARPPWSRHEAVIAKVEADQSATGAILSIAKKHGLAVDENTIRFIAQQSIVGAIEHYEKFIPSHYAKPPR